MKNVGSYAIRADSTHTPTSLAKFYINLENAPFNFINGDVGKVSFDIRHTGTGSASGQWGAFLDSTRNTSDHTLISLSIGDTTWQSVEITFTYDSTYKYLVFRESNSANDGGVYIDNLSVKKAK